MSILLRRLVRVATVVLTACLVSGLATVVKDVAAGVKSLNLDFDMDFGSAAGDADLAETLVESTAGAKTVTGYFTEPEPPVLQSPDGAVLVPELVAALVGPLAPGQGG